MELVAVRSTHQDIIAERLFDLEPGGVFIWIFPVVVVYHVDVLGANRFNHAKAIDITEVLVVEGTELPLLHGTGVGQKLDLAFFENFRHLLARRHAEHLVERGRAIFLDAAECREEDEGNDYRCGRRNLCEKVREGEGAVGEHKCGLHLWHNVLVDHLVLEGKGGDCEEHDGADVKVEDDCLGDGVVIHGWLPIRVVHHQLFDYVHHAESKEAEGEHDGHDRSEEKGDED